MTRTPTNTTRSTRVALEALYPRHSFYKDDEGKIHPVFLGHSETTCDLCEFPFGSQRKHPRDNSMPGHVVVLCDGARMKLANLERR